MAKIYITENRKDLSKDRTTPVFYFPADEMKYILDEPYTLLPLEYTQEQEHNNEAEFQIQKTIMDDKNGILVFIITIERKNIVKLKTFIENEIPPVPGLDIIFSDFILKHDQKKQDLFCFSEKKIYPLYIGTRNYFDRKKYKISCSFPEKIIYN